MKEAKKIHLKTIRKHRKFVRKACFKMGIPIQGLLHDLSKYSKTEMEIWKFATGRRSPHDVARETLGYSPSWYHHMHKNKHHFEYWYDVGHYNKKGEIQILPIKMPYKYVIECFCDMLGASKAYGGENWKPIELWDFWNDRTKNEFKIHPLTENLLDRLFRKLVELGEQRFYNYYKRNKKTFKRFYNQDIFLMN